MLKVKMYNHMLTHIMYNVDVHVHVHCTHQIL